MLRMHAVKLRRCERSIHTDYPWGETIRNSENAGELGNPFPALPCIKKLNHIVRRGLTNSKPKSIPIILLPERVPVHLVERDRGEILVV